MQTTTRRLGLLFAGFIAFFGAYVLAMIPAGWAAERFGARRVLTVGVLVWSTATLLTGAERDGALQHFLAYPMYQSYRTRTDRELRVFTLARR